MADRMTEKTLVAAVVERTGRDVALTEEIIRAALETIYETVKGGESVSLRNFGTFYVRPEPGAWVFKFSPSQRLRMVLGWSSTYRGPV
jgi:DNA-binding protein HU-beta